MRVVTWNAQHGRPNPDGRPEIGRAVPALRSLGADVHAVQELDRGLARSGRADQAARLAEELEAELLWAPTLRRGGEYGIALLVRGEVAGSAVVPLRGRGEPRVLLVAQLDVAGLRWTVGATHLSTLPPVAVDQLLQVIDELARWPLPRVLVGDLNLTTEQVLPWLAPEGYHVARGSATHSTRRPVPTRRIDHVAVAGARVLAAATHDLGVSDHRAVVADVG